MAFINPYNFVSTPPRPTQGPLVDHSAPSFARFHSELFNARLKIRMTTRTPLLLVSPHAQNPVNSAPDSRYTTRRDAEGAPMMLGSSLKGVLRSAYEAITNSRYGSFDEDKYRTPGAMRVPPGYAAKHLFPIWVSAVSDDDVVTIRGVDVLTPYDFDGTVEPSSAALLPIDLAKARLRKAPRIDSLDMVEAEAWLRLQRQGNAFATWKVTDLALPGQDLPATASRLPDTRTNGRPDPRAIRVRGRIHWTDAPFGNRKRHERFFVSELLEGQDWVEFRDYEDTLTDHLATGWKGLIESFVDAHKHETPQQRARHGTYVSDPGRWELRPGRTLWAKYDEQTGEKLVNLSPAMIGRKMFEASPYDLVPENQLPAPTAEHLSPADRLFGWASSDAGDEAVVQPAVRSRLTIDQPRVTGGVDRPIIEFDRPVPLAVLNGPKTSQWLFYTDVDDDAYPKDGGYRPEDRLRGRKFFLPHADTFDDSAYWAPTPGRHAVGDGRFKEYQRPDRVPEQVAGEVSDWVVPGVVFETTIDVRDVSEAELGALLWLLTQEDEDAVLTMGLGKPLGFGAVHVELDEESSAIWSGRAVKDRYLSLVSAARDPLPTVPVDRFLSAYDDAVAQDRGLRRSRDEFQRVLTGYPGHPVHYPRRTRKPEGEGFHWWTDMRKQHAKSSDWRRIALKQLTDRPPTLPYTE
ncbi:MAG: TIGR03986 family CRISPR-associated RAMP protein [Gordonia sp. (in: high G+C Gram-positive bacteria)]|uniref:TIGR03986 family type III CRISPR-associated RAMP protein n=1 Tax=Gordonia sp. (in: high G+C Gram-positive bacteria) TaxID=84139 RepID=UPI0039E2BA44